MANNISGDRVSRFTWLDRDVLEETSEELIIDDTETRSFEVSAPLRRITITRTHSRSKCMACKRQPVIAVHWANGHGMAWFCLKDFAEWVQEDERDIVGVWVLKEGMCPEDIRKTPAGTVKVRKLGEQISGDEIFKRIGTLIESGGPGSGFKGHAGRPGEVGGSQPGGAGGVDPDVRQETEFIQSRRTDESQRLLEFRAEVRNEIANAIADNVDGVDETDVHKILRGWADDPNSEGQGYHLQQMIAEEFGGQLSDWQEDQIAQWLKTIEESEVPQNHPDSAEATELGQARWNFKKAGSDISREESDRLTREVLRTMYDNTQRELSKAGLNSIQLFRGIRVDEAKRFDLGETRMIDMNAAESWTSDKSIASKFIAENVLNEDQAGIVLSISIPRERVLGTALTGFGAWSESEYVVLGHPDQETTVVVAP